MFKIGGQIYFVVRSVAAQRWRSPFLSGRSFAHGRVVLLGTGVFRSAGIEQLHQGVAGVSRKRLKS